MDDALVEARRIGRARGRLIGRNTTTCIRSASWLDRESAYQWRISARRIVQEGHELVLAGVWGAYARLLGEYDHV